MSNEEIVVLIQGGERALITTLWERVERLVAWKANQVITALGGPGGVEFDDLYNSGFLALVAAVDSYKSEEGSFSTWLMIHLKTAFAEATGYRSARQRQDPLHYAVSLSMPMGDEADSDTLAELIPDPEATGAIEAVEERIWRKQLREALEASLDNLPGEQSQTLRKRYFDGMTLAEIAAAGATTPETVRLRADKGLRNLRSPKFGKKLEQFVEQRTPYYLHVGVKEFATTHTSSVERIVMIRERLRLEAQSHSFP